MNEISKHLGCSQELCPFCLGPMYLCGCYYVKIGYIKERDWDYNYSFIKVSQKLDDLLPPRICKMNLRRIKYKKRKKSLTYGLNNCNYAPLGFKP